MLRLAYHLMKTLPVTLPYIDNLKLLSTYIYYMTWFCLSQVHKLTIDMRLMANFKTDEVPIRVVVTGCITHYSK